MPGRRLRSADRDRPLDVDPDPVLDRALDTMARVRWLRSHGFADDQDVVRVRTWLRRIAIRVDLACGLSTMGEEVDAATDDAATGYIDLEGWAPDD